MRHRIEAIAPIALAAVMVAPLPASGHGGEPSVTGLRFPAHRPGEVWAITDNQGLYADLAGVTHWLCEDAVAPAAGVDDIAVLGDGQRWLVLTEEGLFTSDDGGCSFNDAPVDLTDQQIAALSAHPLRPAEAVAISKTFGAENDVWLTTDGGGRWRPAGLALRGRFTGLLRSEVDPERLYAIHDRGGYTSEDGGRRWRPITLAPPELAALPSAITLLAAPAGGPERLFVGVELPTGLALAESEDAGATWREVLRLDDFEAELVFDADGREGLMISAFDGARRTEDGGRTWAVEPLPVDRLQHIGRGPDGRLWGSTGLFFGGPFALGVSPDFGRTWDPALVRFEDVQRRWGCPDGSPARTCCDTLCPGQPLDAMCPGQAPDEGGACAVPSGEPLGPLPGFEPDAGPDQGPQDAAAVDRGPADAGPEDAVVDGRVLDGQPPDGQWLDAAPRDASAPDLGVDATVADAHIADHALDRGPTDGSSALEDTGRPGDTRPPIFAPDVTVIPANPPSDGCAQRPGSPSGWTAVALAAVLGLSFRRRASRRSARCLRRASAP